MNANRDGVQPIVGTVLIIEDDPVLRTLLGYIFTDLGAASMAFPTADDALTYLLQTHDYCALVIADQGLPGKIQGIEFIEMVRDKWPLVRSILTSGYLIKPKMIPRHTVYLHKPWSLDQLITTVATVLPLTAPVSQQPS